MSIWDWVNTFARESYETGDEKRFRLYGVYSEAMEYHARQPEQAVAMLRHGRALAQQMKEDWWVQFYDHWILQVMICDMRDFTSALDLAVHAAVETRKPVYGQLPQRICLQEDLINSYMGIDPEGYADLVDKALDYMEAEVNPRYECVNCIYELRTETAVKLNRPQAEDCALRALQHARGANDKMHTAIAFRHLCTLANRAGNYPALLEYANEATTSAFAAGHNASILSSLMWQSLAQRKNGDERAASRALRTALARANQGSSIPAEDFYDTLCEFHEMTGGFETALQVRQRELEQIAGRGQVARECLCRWHICRLKKLTGQDYSTDLVELEQKASQLKKPEPMLAHAAALRTAV